VLPYHYRATCLFSATLIVFGLAAGAVGQTVTITDLNSTAQFDLGTTGFGLNGWIVDGVNQLAEGSLWYRVGASGSAQRLNTLTLSGYAASGNRLSVAYLAPTFTVMEDWTIFGSTPGFGQSDIGEIVRITNTSQSVLDFHLWQFTDLNLLGTALDTSVSITGGNTAFQYDGATVAQTAAVPIPSRYEAGLRNTVRADVVAGNNLNGNASQTAGDLAFAFQWDRTLAPGASLIISKDYNLNVVAPEPGTLVLAGIAAVGLAVHGWRRRRRA
jgi:hypothetical protein